MKIKSQNDAEEIKLNMTAMIDIVFQLLVFFIMTFKIVAMEGDFNIRMPLTSTEPVQDILDELPNIIKVKMFADDNGNISSIDVSDDEGGDIFNGPDSYKKLQQFVEGRVSGNNGDPTTGLDTEVEFDIAYNLKYQWTVRALDSVSGRVQPDGSVKKLIETIKFKDNSNDANL